MIIAIALYGIKSSGASWRTKIVETLMWIGYKSSKEDAYVWMKRYFKPNGDPYYKYTLCYIDNFLHIYFKPMEDMDAFNMIYWLKEGFGPPDQYQCTNVEKVQLKDG